MDLAISETDGDIYLTSSGDLAVVTGSDAVKQHIAQRLRFVRGEWFMDITRGVPYFFDILGQKAPDLSNLSAVMKDAILGTPGVTGLSSFGLSLDRQTRELTLTFVATSDDGEIDYSGVIA